MGKYTLVGLFFFRTRKAVPKSYGIFFYFFLNNKKYNVVAPVLPQEMAPSVSLEVLENYFKQYASISYLLSCSPNK